ncbi:MAG: hypothetical protein GX853_07690, partial [Chloroflexi bacterium]|nr:hypothetical protein [Chloroflexota bacterium]
HNTESKAGQPSGDGSPATSEQSEKGEQPSQRGRGNEGNNKGEVTLIKGQDLDKINQELSPIDNLNAILSGEKVVPVQSNDKVEETAEKIKQEQKESNAQQQKADIERGKVGDTEYEVKADGVYYQGKKLDNPENKTYRQLIEADIKRRNQEDRGKFLTEIGVEEYGYNKLQNENWREAKNYDLSKAINIAEYQLNKNPNSTMFSLPMYPANAILAELKKHGIDARLSTHLSEIIVKIKEINAKYDAELAALENTTQQEQKVQQSAQKEVEESSPKRETSEQKKSEKLSETESEKAVSQEDKKSENDKSFPKEKSKEDKSGQKVEKIESGELREPQLQYGEKLPSTININGVEKPTTNSEGKPIHSTEEGVRNFYEWFGDSKVVDEQGRPLVVYHGKRTPEQFYSFKKGMNFFSDNLPTAEMFAEENSHALIINGEKRSINKREAEEIQYIIEPYENLEWASGWDLWEDANESQREALSEYLSTYLDYDSNIESLEINLPEEPVYGVYLNIKNPAVKDYSGKTWGEEGTHIEADMRNAISADNKIDGFVAKNISEGGFSAEINGEDPPVQTTYVTTNPNQIKSATSNTGEFSPEDASILNEPNINYQPKYKVSEIGFYSTVEKALSAITQEKGTRDQFKAMLLKNGAKQAEMDWMGWDDQFPDATKKVSKKKQLDIIQSTNPMRDDYHVGIRKLEDIKTFDQVVDDSESFVYGDFSKEDAQKAI